MCALVQVFGQLHHICKRTAGMAADEVFDKLQWLPGARGAVPETLDEAAIMCGGRFAHGAQDVVGDVLGGDLQAPAHVMACQFLEVVPGAVAQRQVEADAAADEDVLHSVDLARRAQ